MSTGELLFDPPPTPLSPDTMHTIRCCCCCLPLRVPDRQRNSVSNIVEKARKYFNLLCVGGEELGGLDSEKMAVVETNVMEEVDVGLDGI